MTHRHAPRVHAVLALSLLAASAAARAEVRAAANAAARTEDLLADTGELEALLAKARYEPNRGAYVAPLAGGREAELTLDHDLQKELEGLLASYNVPTGAIVALDPRDGRILAMAEHSETKGVRGLALKALYPAASVFKIVTGAALVEAGIAPTTEVCFHGGMRRLELKNLRDDARRDTRCASLSSAMGKSLNVVFGKLASRNLSAETLRATAARFFFNQPLPLFPAPPTVGDALVSRAVIPEDELGFGRTAAGFGQVYLSPLHGALLAGAVGNGGIAVEPHLVASIVRGSLRQSPPPSIERRVISEQTSAALTGMMIRTITEGTARKAFRQGRRWVLGDIQAAGKTGSLADKKPFKDYSWFVGFAPAENPTIAVAAVVVNGPRWRVRSPYLGREALRIYFDGEKNKRRRATR